MAHDKCMKYKEKIINDELSRAKDQGQSQIGTDQARTWRESWNLYLVQSSQAYKRVLQFQIFIGNVGFSKALKKNKPYNTH